MIVGFSYSIPFASYLAPESRLLTSVGVINLFMVLMIPLSGLAFLLSRVFFKNKLPKKWRRSLSLFWLINFISLGLVGGHISKFFLNKHETALEIDMIDIKSDTLKIYETNRKPENKMVNFGEVSFDEHQLISKNIDVRIVSGEGSDYKIIKKVCARGQTKAEAKEAADQIEFNFNFENDNLNIDRFLALTKGAKYRNQHVEFEIHIPKGKAVFVDKYILDEIRMSDRDPNYSSGYSNSGKVWINGENGFYSPKYSRKNNDTKTFDNKNFTGLEIEGDMHVEIKQGEKFEVVVKGNEKYTEKVDLVQLDQTLHINSSFKNAHSLVRLKITMPKLLNLGTKNTRDVDIIGFKQEKMNLSNVSNRNTVTAIMDIENLNVSIIGRNELDLKGKGKILSVNMMEKSTLDADRFIVSKVYLNGKHFRDVNLNAIDTVFHAPNVGHQIDVEGGAVMFPGPMNESITER